MCNLVLKLAEILLDFFPKAKKESKINESFRYTVENIERTSKSVYFLDVCSIIFTGRLLHLIFCGLKSMSCDNFRIPYLLKFDPKVT